MGLSNTVGLIEAKQLMIPNKQMVMKEYHTSNNILTTCFFLERMCDMDLSKIMNRFNFYVTRKKVYFTA